MNQANENASCLCESGHHADRSVRLAGVPGGSRADLGRFMTNSRGARSGRLVRSAIAVTAIGLALPASRGRRDGHLHRPAQGRTARLVHGRHEGHSGHQPQGDAATSSRPTPLPGSTTARTWPAARRRCSTGCPAPRRTSCESYRFALAGFAAKLTDRAGQAHREGRGRRPRLEGRRCCSRSRPRTIRTRGWAASTATARPTCA